MESNSINSADFRETQHKNWDAAAPGWMTWSDFNDRADRHISRRLVELSGVRAGGRVLDVAAGYGEPSLTAARVAGPDGRVVATDISADMLEFARQRAAGAGLDNLDFVRSEASGLDFPEASFDAAVSRWGIIFEPDGEAAAERVRGFLKPGARFAISSWGEPDEVPFLSLPMRTMMKRFGVAPRPPGTPGPLSRPTADALGGLLEGGGFSDLNVERSEVVFEFDSPAHFTSYVRAIAAPIRAMIEQHAGGAQEEAWDAITQAASEFNGGDGPVSLSNVVLLAVGTA
jgi:ubiquinone/menaquinone biosynthesis C-methylase UbiE